MRILVVEDEVALATAIAQGLRQQAYAVDVALDGEQGLYLCQINDYDVVLLDINLPKMDGLTLCRRVRAQKSEILILMLTAAARVTERVSGLDAGADDYLTKPFHLEELLARIRALLRRDMRVRDPILEVGDLKLDPASRTVWINNRPLFLTHKEFGILHYLMRHPNEVISQEELIEHVWNEEGSLFSNSVRVHIHSLRRKLGDKPGESSFIETIIGQGYRLASEGNR